MQRVRTGSRYIYRPCLMDRTDPPYGVETGDLLPGQTVQVVRRPGCPPPNTMGMAHIADHRGKFLGLVSLGSLHPR